MVPIGQYTHHERGLNNSMVTKPSVYTTAFLGGFFDLT